MATNVAGSSQISPEAYGDGDLEMTYEVNKKIVKIDEIEAAETEPQW